MCFGKVNNFNCVCQLCESTFYIKGVKKVRSVCKLEKNISKTILLFQIHTGYTIGFSVII